MFVLQGGERMEYKLLKDLYDCFYTPPELPAQKREIEAVSYTHLGPDGLPAAVGGGAAGHTP